nr:hypothetical protein [Tanacetum cinerariifolium]
MSHGSYGAMWKSFARDREVTSTNVCAIGAAPEVGIEEEVAAMGPLLSKKLRKKVNDRADANAPPKIPIGNVATMEVPHTHSTESAGSGKSMSSTSMVGSPEEVHRLKSQAKNLNTLLEAEVDMKKAAKAKNAKLSKELESLRARFTDLQVNNDQMTQQVSTLQTQVTGQERIKAAFEEFKKYEDDRVEKRCAEMDARRDALSIDFDKELYPHMLTVIIGHRWVIGHGLRLAVMKCVESMELRQGGAKLDLAAIKGYDPEANDKYIIALHALKDLKYPLVDQLEGLKDASMEVIRTSLHLKSDSEEDAPKWIRDLRPSTSQLKIPLYPEVRDPKAIKEEMLLKDAIAANVSSAEKKKKCRVVCRTHGVSLAHHARSNGIPVSAPTVALQGLVILLADAAIQTETFEDDASLRLLRSKSLPPMYNLDWA